MDKKYIISTDLRGRLNYVGVNTEEGLKIIKIKDKENATEFIKQIQEINETNGGDFTHALITGDVKLASNYFFKKENRKQINEYTSAKSGLKQAIVNKKVAVLLGLAMACAVTSFAESKDLSIKTLQNIKSKAQTSALSIFKKDTKEQVKEEQTEETLNLEEKSMEELLEMLEEDNQINAFNKILETQDYFNNEAAPEVSYSDTKRLFITFDETVSAYLYANAHSVNSDELASFFGKSKIFLKNPDTKTYETLDSELAAAGYEEFCTNLFYYYLQGATETSGVSRIFENEKEAKFFNTFESKLLRYNQNHSKKSKQALRKALQEIYMSGNIDSYKDKYPGAVSIIGTAIVPYLYLDDVINEKTYDTYIEMNEKVTCEVLKNEIEKLTGCKQKENGDEEIIEEIAKRQNKKVQKWNRNIKIEKIFSGEKDVYEEGSYGAGSGYVYGNGGSTTTHSRTVTTSESKAIRLTSKKAVKKAKAEANKAIKKKNAKENKKAKDLKKGYNDSYNDVMKGGSGKTKGGSKSYKEGSKKGADAAKEDKAQIEKDKQKWEDTHKENKTEIIEEKIVPEKTEPTPEPTPEPEKVETRTEIIEDEFIYGEPKKSNKTQSAPKTEPKNEEKTETKTEVIEDEFIYGEPISKAKVKKVKSVQTTDQFINITMSDGSKITGKVRVRA